MCLDREGRKLSVLSRGGGEWHCRLIEFIKQWTGETDGGHSSHLREVSGSLLSLSGSFSWLYFLDSSQLTV